MIYHYSKTYVVMQSFICINTDTNYHLSQGFIFIICIGLLCLAKCINIRDNIINKKKEAVCYPS